MESKDVYLLENIIGFCDGIMRAVARFGDSFEVFDTDEDYQDACELKIIQIGELVNNLSDAFKTGHPEVPWASIVGTRNFITHEYGSLSNTKVWETIKNDIPELRKFCAKLITV